MNDFKVFLLYFKTVGDDSAAPSKQYHLDKVIETNVRGETTINNSADLLNMAQALASKCAENIPDVKNLEMVLGRKKTVTDYRHLCDWLNKADSEPERRRLCTLVYVKDRNDPDFVWPVFLAGYDIRSENNRADMVKACQEISVRKMGKVPGRAFYADNIQIYYQSKGNDKADEPFDIAYANLFFKEFAELKKDSASYTAFICPADKEPAK